MDLINILPHKRNTTVTVNGHNYPIDGDGLCKSVQKEDAAKLLQNIEAWREFTGKLPGGRQERPAGARIGLLDAGGRPVPPTDVTDPMQDVSATLAAQDQFEAKKRGEANPPPSEAAKWVEPEDGDWPDPIDKMPIDFLRKMADAYAVKHIKRTDKSELIKKIMAEMYPDKKK